MSFPVSDALSILRDAILLLKEEPFVLASPEDAAYFRTRQKKPRSPPPIPALPKNLLPIESGPSKGVAAKYPLPLPPEESPPKEKVPQKEVKIESSIPQPKSRPRGEASSPFRSLLEKVAPELAIIDSIPDDGAAKQIATRWKTKNQSAPISILSSGELPQHKAFLAEIAVALDVSFGPARLIVADSIEKDSQWKAFLSVESLKLIVVCDATLWQLHHLRQFYKETPATGARMLGEVPIFLLPDLSLYLKDPLLKRSLWKALCSRLS